MGQRPSGMAAAPLSALPEKLELAPGDTHLWSVRLSSGDEIDVHGFKFMLSRIEQLRGRRFRFDRDRRRYIEAQGTLRVLLGRYAGIAPEAVAFKTNAYGKPHLAQDPCLYFNLSHGGSMLLIGVTRVAAIGVDIEAVRPLPDRDQIILGCFASDERVFIAMTPSEHRDAAFFRIWTGKEATAKALGTGLSTPLDSFSVIVGLEHGGRGFVRHLAGPWALVLTQPAPGYQGAVALAATDICLKLGALAL